MDDRTPIAELPNLGPRSAQALAAAGIQTLGELRRRGSVAAYAAARQASPNVSLNLLWALEGALTGMAWQDVAREHRTSLLLALESLQAGRR
jgi:DNA transformation protein and related proteins